MSFWDYRRGMLVWTAAGALIGATYALIRGFPLVLVLVAVAMGGYLGFLEYAVYLRRWSQKVRPVRRWNYIAKRWEHKYSVFDWIVFGTMWLPPLVALLCVAAVDLLDGLGVKA
ncbi:MAG TPA: hypothetical protein VLS25_12675, partial [Dehalococcoidia bacterium]|nr:hypothetical protein [Dehalococcoidia bacterium]